MTSIKHVLDDTTLTGTTITVAGWVRTFRNDRFIALFAMKFNNGETDATAFGSEFMSGGNSNTSMGLGTFASLTNGTRNTSIGESSLDDSTSGDQNTYLAKPRTTRWLRLL